MEQTLLSIEHLKKSYDDNLILDDINLEVHQGEVIVLVGPSGCGKSTMLRCINALEPIQGGEIKLNGEKIDVIEWNADLSIYISSALLPAQVMAVDIDEENRVAQVIVPDDQLSLAIGKSGQNARLAAKLTGLSDWRIDIKSETQFRNILMEKQAEMEKADEDNDVE